MFCDFVGFGNCCVDIDGLENCCSDIDGLELLRSRRPRKMLRLKWSIN